MKKQHRNSLLFILPVSLALLMSCAYWRIMGDGNDHYKAGEFNEALEDYKLSLQTKRNVGAYYYWLAMTYAALNKFDSTKIILTEGLRYYPDFSTLNLILGSLYLHHECNPDSALIFLNKAYKETKTENTKKEIELAPT